MLLRIQRIKLSWWRTFGIVMIGLFFNMFLPGLIGGDVARLYFVFKSVPGRKTRATFSVVMDRLFGLFSILLLGAVSLGLRFGWFRRSGASLHIAYLTLAMLGVGAVLVALLFVAVGFGLLHRLPQRTPFRKTIIESGEALDLYRTHCAVMAAAFSITIVSHIAYYLSYYCAGQSLHAAGRVAGLIDMLSIMPLVNTVTALPISFGGAGVRETLFQELLGNLAHVPQALAAFSASLGFAIQASWGVLGSAVYLFRATDGELGTVDQFYFDDETWAIRYLTVDTGGWLGGRRVLISPISVVHTDWPSRRLDVALTKKQVENSPDIDTHKPVSRQHEAAFLGYYGYPYYWGGPYLWGASFYPAGLAMPTTAARKAMADSVWSESTDSHLRSSEAVTGYHIEASDGEIGHVDGFVLDDEAWAIRYIEVATRNWWPGKKVLISPAWIERVSWTDSKVYVGLSRETIKDCPAVRRIHGDYPRV